MKDLRRYIANGNHKPVPIKYNYDETQSLLEFFAYCIYNSFKEQTDVSKSLSDIIDDEDDLFVLSWDEYDQMHIRDAMSEELKEDHWIRKIILDAMIPGDYEISQVSQYVDQMVDDDDPEYENSDYDEGISDIEWLMKSFHLSKADQKRTKNYYKEDMSDCSRMFAIVVTSPSLARIYKHKDLRKAFEDATQLEFKNSTTLFMAYVIYEESGNRTNMVEPEAVDYYIQMYNKKIKQHKRMHKENIVFANKVANMAGSVSQTANLIESVLHTFETESQVMF